jgi:hypothetical protein
VSREGGQEGTGERLASVLKKDIRNSEARVSREGGQKGTGERLTSVLEGQQEH